MRYGEQFAARRRRQHHRHEPDRDRAEHEQRTPASQRASRCGARRRPATRARARRTESATSSGRKPTPLVMMPRPAAAQPTKNQPAQRAREQVAQQAVERQRREETQRRVDLRLARLPDELERAEQQQRRRRARLRDRARDAAGRTRAQRCRPPRAATAAGNRAAPSRSAPSTRASSQKNTGGLSGYRSPPTRGIEPVAGAQHVVRDQREARLVGRPRIAQPESRAHQQQREARSASSRSTDDGAAIAFAPGRSKRSSSDRALPAPVMRQSSSWTRDAR